jgi:hypothetical protein
MLQGIVVPKLPKREFLGDAGHFHVRQGLHGLLQTIVELPSPHIGGAAIEVPIAIPGNTKPKRH